MLEMESLKEMQVLFRMLSEAALSSSFFPFMAVAPLFRLPPPCSLIKKETDNLLFLTFSVSVRELGRATVRSQPCINLSMRRKAKSPGR